MARRRTPAQVPAVRVLPDFTHLPAPVDPATLVTSEPASLELDPFGNRDLDQEFVVRYGLAAL